MAPTTQELKAAFKGSRLWCVGWSFNKAMSVPMVRRTLEYAVSAAHKQRAAAGNTPPTQSVLF